MLSVSECAALLDVSQQRVRQLVSEGMLPATKIGNAWAIREEDAYARLAQHRKPGRPVSPDFAADAKPPSEPSISSSNDAFKQIFETCEAKYAACPSADELASFSNPEAAAFRAAVADFFLRRKQVALIKQGVF